MKRRHNKKTGEIIEYDEEVIYYRKLTSNGHDDWTPYHPEDWEDYTPAEPYIKDEKIRKFVRDWATFNKIVKACIWRPDDNDNWYKILGNDKEARCAWAIHIHASYSETISEDYNCDAPMVAIAELCGEEEE